MDDSTRADQLTAPGEHLSRSDNIALRRWFAFFAIYIVALGAAVAALLADIEAPGELFADPGAYTAPRHQALKLLIYAFYLSLCCTFLPLPTGGMVAAMSTAHVAVTGQLWSTVLLVAVTGAAGSTVANLNDYHLFTLLLRSRRVARLRRTRLYARAARWFARAPFVILLLANIVPIPIDVVRVLAITYRYPRAPFAAANFIGRFIRYALLATVTYVVGKQYQMHVVIGMFALAAALALWRMLAFRMHTGPAGAPTAEQPQKARDE